MPLNSCAIWSNSKEVCFTWDVRVGVNLRHCTRTRTWGLVEGHADPVLLAPDDVAGNVRAVRLKKRLKRSGMSWGSATSSAAPEMVMSQTKQLIKQPAN